MTPKTSLPDLEALLRRAGLTLTKSDIASVHQGWGYAEAMLERLRTPAMPREAEPATIFKADAFAPGAIKPGRA